MQAKHAEDFYKILKDVHKGAVKRIREIMKELGHNKLNLFYFRTEWEVCSLPTIFSINRHDFAMAMDPDDIVLTKNGFCISASDEGGSSVFTSDELDACTVTHLLEAVEDIQDIMSDPDNKDNIDMEEMTR